MVKEVSNMDCTKVGKLLYDLRKEKRMTQKEIADKMNISDKTVSKWERGLGCPDISLLSELSDIFGVNIEKILQGDLSINDTDGGNMKRIKFYVCPVCGNIITSTGLGEISCCGRKLESLQVQEINEEHNLQTTQVENDYYLTFNHEMTKDHYISFIAYVMFDRVHLVKLYPEQNAEVRIPIMRKGDLYFYCSKHGLMKQKI